MIDSNYNFKNHKAWEELVGFLLSKERRTTVIDNQYYSRLINIIIDESSSDIDKLSAYRDALFSAPNETPKLPFEVGIDRHLLKRFGLTTDPLGKWLSLSFQSSYIFDDKELAPVYKLQNRRHLKRLPIDPSLRQRLNDSKYSHYNGEAQKNAVRIALTTPLNSTLLVNLPTGVGKTLVAHALAAFSNEKKLTLVIVPTIALAIEQGKRAKEMLAKMGTTHGSIYHWHGEQDEQIHNDLKERIKLGKQQILFCSPEAACRSLLPILFDSAQNNRLANIIIDEAHIVEQWGVSFRPDFQIFSALMRTLREQSSIGIKCTLLSATFTENSLQVLTELFGVKDQQPIEIHGNFLRPEIQYKVKQIANSNEYIKTVEQSVIELPKPLIIYAVEREDADWIYTHLKNIGYSRIAKFTGGTRNSDREKILNQWQDNDKDIIVATSAFGVGMDKQDVRSILHIAVPENLDRFYQEVGRAGRDGKACQSILIYKPESFSIARKINAAHLITIEVGLKRWKVLWAKGIEIQNGMRLIKLNTIHSDLDRMSISNREWNWRTLLLMQRSNLISIQFNKPSPPEWNPNIPTLEYQKDREQYYDDYYNEVVINPLVDNHLELDCWDQKVGLQRNREKVNQSNGFNTLNDWIINNEQKCISTVLGSFYSINGIEPEKVCGGCPWCKKNNHQNEFFPTLGKFAVVKGKIISNKWKSPLQNLKLHQKVYYLPPERTVRSLIRNWNTWMFSLIEKQAIQLIRTDKEHADAILRSFPKSSRMFWMYEELTNELEDSYWSELIIVPFTSKNIPSLGFEESPRLLLVSDHVNDISRNERPWWVHDSTSKSLENFLLSI